MVAKFEVYASGFTVMPVAASIGAAPNATVAHMVVVPFAQYVKESVVVPALGT